MNAFSQRTWIPFYVVSLGTLSFGIFRSMNGLMLVFSLLVVSAALGIIFIAIQAEVTKSTEKKELMEVLSRKVIASGDSRDSRAK